MDKDAVVAIALCETTEMFMAKALEHPEVTPHHIMCALMTNALMWNTRFGGTRDNLVEVLKGMPLCPEEQAAQDVMGELGMIVMAIGGGNPDRGKDND